MKRNKIKVIKGWDLRSSGLVIAWLRSKSNRNAFNRTKDSMHYWWPTVLVEPKCQRQWRANHSWHSRSDTEERTRNAWMHKTIVMFPIKHILCEKMWSKWNSRRIYSELLLCLSHSLPLSQCFTFIFLVSQRKYPIRSRKPI